MAEVALAPLLWQVTCLATREDLPERTSDHNREISPSPLPNHVMLSMEQQALQARRQSSLCVGLGPSSARCAQQGSRPSKPAKHFRKDDNLQTRAATVSS